MKTLSRSLLILVLALSWIGCDSNEATDAEKFVGAWTLSKIEDGTGDITAQFQAGITTFRATLNADNTSTLVVTYSAAAQAAGATNINDSGTYSVNETTKVVTLNHLGAALPLNYNFPDDNTAELSANSAIINAVFSSAYTGTVTLTVNKP